MSRRSDGVVSAFSGADALDVVGVHLVGGLIGTLAIGLLAMKGGLFYGGGTTVLDHQVIAAVAVLTYSFVVTYGIGKALDALMGLRLSPAAESSGADVNEHAEIGYDLSNVRYSNYQRVHSTVIVPAAEQE